MNKIYSIGIGPGGKEYMTAQALEALNKSDVVIGYKFYIKLVADLIADKEVFDTGMKKEQERSREAFRLAQMGKTVSVISSGDSGVYGMASLLWEMKGKENYDTEVEVIPGISAMMAAAAKMGAPLGHDFCSVSMSDLLTPWETIEKRIKAAAEGDFITAVYNPKSNERFWQLARLREVFLQYRSADTPVGIGRQVGREEESFTTTTLGALDVSVVDMFTIVIIGNSQSYIYNNKVVTPRGYYNGQKEITQKIGRQIMNESFRTILQSLDADKYSPEHLWVALHAVHTTADFSVADLLEVSEGIVEKLNNAFYSGKPPVIVTDVNMVTRGIRKALVKKLGIEVKCYLDDERTEALAAEKGITRTQAGIRIAVQEHPEALYVFGNAPTALIELVKFIRKGTANPIGVIGAPVGFVNVCESKWQLKHGCTQTPHIIVSGRKGGSNLAATIINAALSWSDFKNMNPGEGL